MKPLIRAANEKDYDEIKEIYAFDEVMEQTTQLPHRDAAFWKGFYAAKGPSCMELVAISEGRVIGHLGILPDGNPRRKHVASFGIAVHPEFQGRGAGSALMEELIRLGDNWLDILRLELSVFSDNGTAVALYRKFGFVIEGEARYDVFRRGRYASGYRMARYNPARIDTPAPG
ncbi:MAG: GNAT family N-acetyltransferase [Chlorobiales bacterium]|nr:GNAT family N-acetyltransferase [Chlorobiales bacterium]